MYGKVGLFPEGPTRVGRDRSNTSFSLSNSFSQVATSFSLERKGWLPACKEGVCCNVRKGVAASKAYSSEGKAPTKLTKAPKVRQVGLEGGQVYGS